MLYRPSKELIDLLKHFESFSDKVYICPAGYPTIGYGEVVEFTKYKSVPAHLVGRTTDKKTASRAMMKHIAAERILLRKMIKPAIWRRMKAHQQDALLSLVYNIGRGKFKRSKMLRQLNRGNFAAMPKHFASYRRGAGKILKGLVRRRCAEIMLWLGLDVKYRRIPKYYYEAL